MGSQPWEDTKLMLVLSEFDLRIRPYGGCVFLIAWVSVDVRPMTISILDRGSIISHRCETMSPLGWS